eukprot:TRINITY_DN4347_c0_g2_i5.p1 TRINITY_DN4347_c0_g2~~TRINITY_DN4347_c0_g2_i5.p1  ORF type:complete len:239 (-),score=29.51 TRINITY_DN4347_c0_g2_i5:66-782(-)
MCIRDRGSLLLSTKLFFFQAEDGIRDHAQSRGLGDVYKRQLPYTPWARQNRATTDPSENSTNSPCFTDAPMDNYFNRLDVKRALNMPSDIVWRLCNDELYDTYVRDEKGSMEVYPKLFEAGIKILIVNGDADSVVNFNEFYIWGPHLGLKVIEDWKQWRVGDQVAGFITKYNNNLTFATVKGAGHQAPSSKRRETFELLTRFLNDQLQTIVFRAKTYFCPRSTAGEPDEIHGYHVCTL